MARIISPGPDSDDDLLSAPDNNNEYQGNDHVSNSQIPPANTFLSAT